ncbi:MAG: hypothetical protein ACQESC_01620 [Nanobdellota archaeon]
MFLDKKGFNTKQKFSGLIIGIILGALLVFLVAKGIIPLFSICG